MTYRHLSHCLSRYIPARVFTEYDLLGLFCLRFPTLKKYWPSFLLLSWMPYTSSKSIRCQMITQSSHSFFPSEDKNVVSILCLHFHSWPSPKLTVVSPSLLHDTWNGKTQLSLLCNQGWSKTPSWPRTCQSSLLTRDSFIHQQLLRGSLSCLISFLSLMSWSLCSNFF